MWIRKEKKKLWKILFFNFFKFYFIFKFYNIVLVCQISKWIHHRYTCVPHSEPFSLLPPHTVPLGCPSAPAPSIQYHASNLDWWLVPYMILYVFKCHSPKSSHPLPLPQSPVCGTAKETQRPYFDGQRVERWWSRKSLQKCFL